MFREKNIYYCKYLEKYRQQEKQDAKFGFSGQKLSRKHPNLDIKNFLLRRLLKI